VAIDDAATGRLAATHLLNKGLAHIACVHYPRWANDAVRLAAFRSEVEQAGIPVRAIAVWFRRPVRRLETERPEVDTARLARLLDNLPRPVGIFATHDEFAVAAVEALRSLGASLPYDAPILGQGNNRLICESCDPPLSSLVQPGQQIGFQAAAALHRLLRGERLAPRHLSLAPVEVAVRRSTDVMATRDELVVKAIEQIRLRSNEPFTVEQLAELMNVSRSGLYKRFMTALGHTPTEEIRRTRLARAAKLLTTTEMEIPVVAFDCGYRSVGAFCRAFRQATGTTPLEYRKKTRSSE
jgi:LacI family transcriptional regulator